MDLTRIRKIKETKNKKGPILYWMSRDQRVFDNWAFLYAQKLAKENSVPLIVIFCLSPNFLRAGLRHYDFMLRGLKTVEKELRDLNVPFFLLSGTARLLIPEFILKNKISNIITDFDPLRIKRIWQRDIARSIDIPFYEVDAHNIVPCWVASPKMEVAAYTIRPKIEKLLPQYLDEFPFPEIMPKSLENNVIDWDEVLNWLNIDKAILPVKEYKPGEDEALKMLNDFIEYRLGDYNELRNNPLKDAQSGLSPYLHFGQLSSQRAVLNIQKLSSPEKYKSFCEEITVRKELADNFCFYNPKYDTIDGFPEWALASLNAHRNDHRNNIYSLEEFETMKTHSKLWNATQNELVKKGKIHGYMRMYWAKKILQWGKNPEDSLNIANYLNDKYSLDGRDPNGYTGTAWSIGGLHDRPWKERPILGKIRYMNESGCRRKFDVDLYIKKSNGNEEADLFS